MYDLITMPPRTPAVVKPQGSGMEELKRLNQRLAGLLSDPHPGLFTWKQSLSDTLLEMADYAGYGMVSEMARRNQG